MTVIEDRADALWSPGASHGSGPMTRARLTRTAGVYAVMWLAGLAPWLAGSPGPWQAAGLGLWAPGAGFVAVGGWAIALFPITLALFGLSLVAWFWAGMVLAPLSVWLGAAALAGVLAGERSWPGAHALVAVALAGFATLSWRSALRRAAAGRERFAARAEFLPQSLAEVRARAAATAEAGDREMSAEQLASLRYVLDRALQPIDRFDGFDIIDQFQPAALRYQLNHLGFALGIARTAYTPSFSGYLDQAQRSLIEKYLLKRVWDYWVYESCWGHLNFTHFDPAAKDNIMLTGWLGMHVGQYMLSSGDRRYGEPGSLTFRLNDRTAFRHDFHSLIGSITDNYTRDERAFCLYPCEPNWIYPICNHYGMTALATHDRLYGTDHCRRFLPSWLAKLDAEFTDESGSIIGLRSQLTGLEAPFPTGEAGYAGFANCFAPERAQRLWAIARREIAPAIGPSADGRARLHLPGKGLDAGNYRTGHTASYASILVAAREFGDDDIAQAAQASLDLDCAPSDEGGVRAYLGGSNLANANAAMGALMHTGDFRRSFVEGPPPQTQAGPVLKSADYPDVLVAKAIGDGAGLELVLHPGAAPGRKALILSGLRPGAQYTLAGAAETAVQADIAGEARIEVTLRGRTVVHVRPA
jgi:hypothetical protein